MSESRPTDPDQIALVEQLVSVDSRLADWAMVQFTSGKTVDQVKETLRRVMRIAAPIRSAETPLHPLTAQTETEFNLNWADANPELFAQAVRAFQAKTPITHWRHHIDMSRECFVTLIAVRRKEPYADFKAYLADGDTYLREIGNGR